ncbi:MAG: Gfo/Idh/MocA family oxidoreductase, partial [bacterium]|nr:Gfo/Idh/MocA family oxidoreductase [bacterium]
RYAELLGQNQIKNARIAAVCDIVPSRAEELSKKSGVPFYSDMFKMMESEKKLDVISVLTPSGMHAEHVIALSRYKKHIVVEKPMAMTLDDADSMIKACDRNNIKLFVVKQNRFNLPVQKLREAIEKGRFGKLVLGTVRVRWCRRQDYYDMDKWRGTWAYDGGVIINQASHHIDLLEWMMGNPESVFAKSLTALVDIETEDTAVATLKFHNGALGIIEATTATRPKDLEGSISILGEGGTVEIGGFAANEIKIWNFADEKEEDREIVRKYSVNPPSVYGFGHQAYLQNVVNCIERGESALVDGLEGRKSLELITAMYESIETGKEVFLRFKPKKCRLGHK